MVKNRLNRAKNSEAEQSEALIIIIAAVIFIGCIGVIKWLSSISAMHIMGVVINGGTLCGAITEIPVMIAIWLTIKCRRYGYAAAIVMYIAFMTSLTTALIFKHESGFFPGSVMIICGIVICTLLRRYLNNIDENDRKLNSYANTDDLTGLPNRRSLMKRLNTMTTERSEFALVFIDLDNFKLINDTSGHDDGDLVLLEISRRWCNILSDKEFIARFGGDEFTLVIKDYTSIDSLISRVSEFADVVKDKIETDGGSHIVAASFGIALYPEQADNASLLLRYADTAMYSSKENGKSHIEIFNSSMAAEIESDANIEVLIRKTLENDGFYAMYQPQFGTNKKNLRGFEVLARMKDEYGNVISPALFIPVAEKNGLISQIERVIMKKALSTFSDYANKSKSGLLIAVNVSVAHLQEESFIADVWNILHETGFPAECLEIEITESLLISSVTQAVEKLTLLKKMGIKIALDDFGTGFASLSYLHKLPIDLLKVDKCFVDNIEASDEETNFVDAIISMGHALHYSVISEGVETEGQLEILKKINCDCIQGYLWGTPLSMEDAFKLLDEDISLKSSKIS